MGLPLKLSIFSLYRYIGCSLFTPPTGADPSTRCAVLEDCYRSCSQQHMLSVALFLFQAALGGGTEAQLLLGSHFHAYPSSGCSGAEPLYNGLPPITTFDSLHDSN
jgi:hypothetical protein